mmetsp:Transcript_81957/g.232326  ORF Transcript_81957/g.232326 Transcript_81957/m.232326 type:complete len:206 (+) Transcript_81957:77-694(+)
MVLDCNPVRAPTCAYPSGSTASSSAMKSRSLLKPHCLTSCPWTAWKTQPTCTPSSSACPPLLIWVTTAGPTPRVRSSEPSAAQLSELGSASFRPRGCLVKETVMAAPPSQKSTSRASTGHGGGSAGLGSGGSQVGGAQPPGSEPWLDGLAGSAILGSSAAAWPPACAGSGPPGSRRCTCSTPLAARLRAPPPQNSSTHRAPRPSA